MKILVIWKVRHMPKAVSRWAGWPVMFRPSKTMAPELAGMRPVMTLIRVVFPAPLGPIMDLSRFSLNSMLTALVASTPPK